MTRRRLLVLSVLAVLAGVEPHRAGAAGEVEVGAVRSTFQRGGTRLLEEPRPLAAVAALLPYGTLVRIERVQAPWAEVTPLGTGEAARRGWLRVLETVEPTVLGPRRGIAPLAGASGRGADVSAREASTAGRQLTEGTEEGYRRSNADVARAYPLVDRLEEASRAIDPATIDEFIRRGRLGRPGR